MSGVEVVFLVVSTSIFNRGQLNQHKHILTEFMQSTKVSFHGPGSKPPPREPSSSSLPPKPNTMPAHLEPVISPLVSVEESQEE